MTDKIEAAEREELSACPFCGGKASMESALIVRDPHFWAACRSPNCPAVLHGRQCKSRAEAVAAWNTRTGTSPVVSDEMVEGVEKIKITFFGKTLGCSAQFEPNGIGLAIGQWGEDDQGRTTLTLTQSGGGVPEGWKLVPVEPTQEMLDVGTEKADNGKFSGQYLRGIYQAMLAASPAGDRRE